MADALEPDPGAAIAALRALGAERREPLRLLVVTALARRTALHGGALRQLLDARLARALADLQQRLALPAAADTTTPLPGPGASPAPGPLAALLQHTGTGPVASALPAAGARPVASAAPAELKAVRQFAGTWARLRVDQQLQRSQARQPENAGPLNSQRLVLQALQRLRSLSPAYLQRFLAHADALLWLEAAGSATLKPRPAGGAASRATAPGRSRS